MDSLFSRDLSWTKTSDVLFPFRTEADGKSLKLRLNDFPAEAMYTLFVDENNVGDFDNWPPLWRK
jgi:hypothetical protein